MNCSEKSLIRFQKNINKTTTCWFWIGTITKSGYGQFTMQNRHYRAHRFAYELFKEEIPKGLCLDHLCRNRSCVNPDHLEAVTSRENILRGISPIAINFRKKKCTHGHLYTPENTVTTKTGRECRTCRINYFKRYDQNPERKKRMILARKKYELKRIRKRKISINQQP